MKFLLVVSFILSRFNLIAPTPISNDLFNVSIIHLNDFHARFEMTSLLSTKCKANETCIGGFARTYYQITKLQKEQPDSIFLNAGDNFQGTLWEKVFKWRAYKHFFNLLNTDAYTLGNHEFDHEVQGLVPFIKSVNAPILVANIDDSLEAEIQGLYKKSTVIKRGGQNIGIIGVIAQNTNELSSTGKLKFTDEAEAVNKEAKHLVAKGVKIIIVLSHCGLDVDKKMAVKLVPHVNLIVGGHSHSFLYSGNPPGFDKPVGPYPVIVQRENNRKVLIVQASAYTKYLGNIKVWYNDNGDIVKWKGNPIYLDEHLPEDMTVAEDIATWKKEVDTFGDRILGSTNVLLSKDNSHNAECLLGDFMADAIVDHFKSKAAENEWTYSSIAIVNSGGIRTSIPIGNITFDDLVTTSPFESTIDVGELTGQQILDFLEFAVDETMYGFSFRQFLQVSGLRVVFDLRKPIGSRIVDLKIKSRFYDEFKELNRDEIYRIAMPSFLVKGGDGFSMIRDNLRNIEVGPVDIDIFEAYIRKMSPITQDLDGRIKIIM